MKLLYILAAILAVTLALDVKKTVYDDSQAVATTANKREAAIEEQDLAVSAYSYPQWPQSNWQNVQEQTSNVGNPVSTLPNLSNNWGNQPSNWGNTNQWSNQANNWVKPSNWGNTPSNWINPSNVQNDDWSATTTTSKPVAVIKNEHYYGENGNYKYEYQIGDGTHVGEEGYFTNSNQDEESLVKKGWYSFVDANGKTYTVTYWADKTGFHAVGDHLPTPPPVPAAIQAALDKQKEAEKNKPLNDYPSQTPAPLPVYPTQPTPVYTPKPVYRPVAPSNQNYNPTYNPTQQYYPTQSTYYPQQQYPQQQYPQQQYPQQQYPQQQYPQQQYPQYQQQQFQQQQQTNYASNYNV